VLQNRDAATQVPDESPSPEAGEGEDAPAAGATAGSSSSANAFTRFFAYDMEKRNIRHLENYQKQAVEMRTEWERCSAECRELFAQFSTLLREFAMHFESMEHLRCEV